MLKLLKAHERQNILFSPGVHFIYSFKNIFPSIFIAACLLLLTASCHSSKGAVPKSKTQRSSTRLGDVLCENVTPQKSSTWFQSGTNLISKIWEKKSELMSYGVGLYAMMRGLGGIPMYEGQVQNGPPYFAWSKVVAYPGNWNVTEGAMATGPDYQVARVINMKLANGETSVGFEIRLKNGTQKCGTRYEYTGSGTRYYTVPPESLTFNFDRGFYEIIINRADDVEGNKDGSHGGGLLRIWPNCTYAVNPKKLTHKYGGTSAAVLEDGSITCMTGEHDENNNNRASSSFRSAGQIYCFDQDYNHINKSNGIIIGDTNQGNQLFKISGPEYVQVGNTTFMDEGIMKGYSTFFDQDLENILRTHLFWGLGGCNKTAATAVLEENGDLVVSAKTCLYTDEPYRDTMIYRWRPGVGIMYIKGTPHKYKTQIERLHDYGSGFAMMGTCTYYLENNKTDGCRLVCNSQTNECMVDLLGNERLDEVLRDSASSNDTYYVHMSRVGLDMSHNTSLLMKNSKTRFARNAGCLYKNMVTGDTDYDLIDLVNGTHMMFYTHYEAEVEKLKSVRIKNDNNIAVYPLNVVEAYECYDVTGDLKECPTPVPTSSPSKSPSNSPTVQTDAPTAQTNEPTGATGSPTSNQALGLGGGSSSITVESGSTIGTGVTLGGLSWLFGVLAYKKRKKKRLEERLKKEEKEVKKHENVKSGTVLVKGNIDLEEPLPRVFKDPLNLNRKESEREYSQQSNSNTESERENQSREVENYEHKRNITESIDLLTEEPGRDELNLQNDISLNKVSRFINEKLPEKPVLESRMSENTSNLNARIWSSTFGNLNLSLEDLNRQDTEETISTNPSWRNLGRTDTEDTIRTNPSYKNLTTPTKESVKSKYSGISERSMKDVNLLNEVNSLLSNEHVSMESMNDRFDVLLRKLSNNQLEKEENKEEEEMELFIDNGSKPYTNIESKSSLERRVSSGRMPIPRINTNSSTLKSRESSHRIVVSTPNTVQRESKEKRSSIKLKEKENKRRGSIERKSKKEKKSKHSSKSSNSRSKSKTRERSKSNRKERKERKDRRSKTPKEKNRRGRSRASKMHEVEYKTKRSKSPRMLSPKTRPKHERKNTKDGYKSYLGSQGDRMSSPGRVLKTSKISQNRKEQKIESLRRMSVANVNRTNSRSRSKSRPKKHKNKSKRKHKEKSRIRSKSTTRSKNTKNKKNKSNQNDQETNNEKS